MRRRAEVFFVLALFASVAVLAITTQVQAQKIAELEAREMSPIVEVQTVQAQVEVREYLPLDLPTCEWLAEPERVER